jgi:hypothetical protein
MLPALHTTTFVLETQFFMVYTLGMSLKSDKWTLRRCSVYCAVVGMYFSTHYSPSVHPTMELGPTYCLYIVFLNHA